MNKKNSKRKSLIALLFLILAITSCRTKLEVATGGLNPIPFDGLLEKVEENAFDYNNLTIKRINCQYTSGKNTTGFIANLKAEKNQKILISITKIGILVGRVLLTPDSVKYVNYFEKNYFIDDYSYLGKILNMDLDFETVQSIISNNAVQLIKKVTEMNKGDIQAVIESGMHLIKNSDITKNNPIQHKLYFSSGNFILSHLNIEDNVQKRKIDITFNDFQSINEKQYPGNIEMKLSSPGKKLELSIRNSGFSVEKIESFSFSIPTDYEKLNTLVR